jgi:protein CMS1
MSDSDAGVPLIESDSPPSKGVAGQKRKRVVTDESKEKRKSKRKAKRITDDNSEFDAENSLNTAIGKMDNALLADYVAQRIRKFGKELTSVELDERYIAGA